MLEHEQSLKINPGKDGGYFSRRPAIDTAIKSASQYLSSKYLERSEALFMECAAPIITSIVAKAVHCQDQSPSKGPEAAALEFFEGVSW